MSDYLARTNNGTSFAGSDMDIFRATMLAGSLRLFAKTGMIPTRGVTGAKMLKMANELTGHVYKRGQYECAAQALLEFADRKKQESRVD